MSKNKKAGNKTIYIVFPDNISAEEVKSIITEGMLEFEEQKKQRENEEKEARRKAWQNAIGVKDFSNVKKTKRWLLQFCNDLKTFWKICTISQKDVRGDDTVFNLIQAFIVSIFAVIFVICMLLSLVFSIAFPILLFLGFFPGIPLNIALLVFFLGILAFVFSQAFRIASFEVTNIEDRSYLFNLFTCVVSTISMIVAVIALFAARG